MRIVGVIAVLALAGCASSMPAAPPATQAEKDAAARLYVGCLVANAEDLDDGTSDAASVGRVVAAACRRELRAQIDVITRGGTEVLRQSLYEDMQQDDAVRGAGIVLDVRRRRAASRPG